MDAGTHHMYAKPADVIKEKPGSNSSSSVVDNREASAQQHRLIEAISNSPRQATQRKEMAVISAAQPAQLDSQQSIAYSHGSNLKKRSDSSNVVQRALKTDQELTAIRDKRGYYNWKGLRTKLDDDDDGHKKASGFGANTDDNKALKTNIKWGAPTAASGSEGISMVADPLGPDHPLGSAPSSSGIWANRRSDFSALSRKRYIAGHLLNENLGGPGNVAENLTAIPSSANSEHSKQVEEPIKEEVNDKGKWMHYSVDLRYSPLDNVVPNSMGYTASTAPKRKAAAKELGGYEDGTKPNTIKLMYASAIRAKWGAVDSEGGKVGAIEGKTIAIEKPSVGTSVAAVELQADDANAATYDEDITDDGNDGEQAVTTIGYESLVLNNTDAIRAAHRARKPVIDHHEAYEDETSDQIANLEREIGTVTQEKKKLKQNNIKLYKLVGSAVNKGISISKPTQKTQIAYFEKLRTTAEALSE